MMYIYKLYKHLAKAAPASHQTRTLVAISKVDTINWKIEVIGKE